MQILSILYVQILSILYVHKFSVYFMCKFSVYFMCKFSVYFMCTNSQYTLCANSQYTLCAQILSILYVQILSILYVQILSILYVQILSILYVQILYDFFCVGVMYSGEYDVFDVTRSVYPHRASLKNMPGHGGSRTSDLWNTSPMLLGAEPISVYYDIVYHSVLSIQVTLCPTLLYHWPWN